MSPRIAGHTDKRFIRKAVRRILMRRRYSYQLDPLRVWLLLRLRRRCGWRRVCRGRSRSRARQQIPNEDQGKDNCRCDDEQPVCVHRVCPRFSLPHHVNPPWGSGTSQTSRAEKPHMAVRPEVSSPKTSWSASTDIATALIASLLVGGSKTMPMKATGWRAARRIRVCFCADCVAKLDEE